MPFGKDQDPREHGRKGGRARAGTELSDAEIEALSRSELIDRLRDKGTPAYALPKIIEQLTKLAERDSRDEDSWRRSVQVRPDYKPPTWEDVLRVARDAGVDV